jgi:SAM-dependent methyltransferase
MRHAPATLRNREPILNVLARVLPKDGVLLEIASGTGEHAAFIAPRLDEIVWQPTDRDGASLADIDGHTEFENCARIRPAIALDAAARDWPVDRADAVFCCNMIHIAPWHASVGLFEGAARVLTTGAPLILYGPYRRHGAHTAASNVKFEEWLRCQDRRFGVRCLDTQVTPLAERCGFSLDEIVEMPANNLTVVWRRN